MSNQLSPENEQYLQYLVSQGTFPTQTDALNAAVGLLRQRQNYSSQVQTGIAEADAGKLIPAVEVFDRLERRAEEIERLAGN